MTVMTDDLVPVLTPRSLLGSVYRLIADAEAAGTRTASRAEEAQPPASQGWSDELIERAYSESPQGMLAIFDYMSDHPEEWLTADDLANALKPFKPHATWNEVAGTLGAFSRRVKTGYQRTDWPLESQNRNGRWVHMMPKRVADLILRLQMPES